MQMCKYQKSSGSISCIIRPNWLAYNAPTTTIPTAPRIMLIPKLFFPALLVCNDALPVAVLEELSGDPVTTAGTTVTDVTVDRAPLGSVVVKTLVEVLLVVLLLVASGACVVLSSEEAVDSAMLVDVEVIAIVEEESVARELAELVDVDRTLSLEACVVELEVAAEVVAPEAVA